MRIVVTNVFVDDQQQALKFYTEKLGFQTKHDIPLGEHRWLTVTEADKPDGIELLLEPSSHPAVAPFKSALVEDGIPYASFRVADINAEHERLQSLGVQFVQPPTKMGAATTALLDDTCGNLIQIIEHED
jgi:catechol 2,3-dioxygenase-like lactoylglutathione lyase family enzyme